MSRDRPVVSATGVTRRRFVGTTAGVCSLAAAGCLSDDNDGSADDGGESNPPEEITFLHYETADDRRAAIDDLGERFTGITDIEISQRVVQEADLPVTITSSVAADTLPEVGTLGLSVLHSATGAIDAESATAVVNEIGADRFYENVLELASVPGEDQYYGVPLYTWPQFTFCRREVFDDEGLEPARTWDQWLTAAEALHDPDNNQFGVIIGTERDPYTRQCFTGFALANNAHVFSPDGEIVFDSDAMVEALEFYASLAEFTPPGEVDSGTIGPIYDEGNAHLYSGNAFSVYFNSLGLDENEEIGEYIVPVIEESEEATYGEVVCTTTMTALDEPERDAAESWQAFLRGSEDIQDYIDFCHIQVGGFQPVMPEVRENDDYRSHELMTHWPEELSEEIIPESIQNMERFGYRDGQVFPEIGPITANFLIAGAVSDVIDGEDAQTVAEDTADAMRDQIN